MFKKGSQRLQAVLARYEKDRQEILLALTEIETEHTDLETEVSGIRARQFQLRFDRQRANEASVALSALIGR